MEEVSREHWDKDNPLMQLFKDLCRRHEGGVVLACEDCKQTFADLPLEKGLLHPQHTVWTEDRHNFKRWASENDGRRELEPNLLLVSRSIPIATIIRKPAMDSNLTGHCRLDGASWFPCFSCSPRMEKSSQHTTSCGGTRLQ